MIFTNLFYKIAKSKARFVVNQGGTSSSKTYSTLQLLIIIAHKYDNILISVVAESLPHLKRGAIRDFTKIMQEEGLWSDDNWNASDKIYSIGRTRIEFFSADNGDKLRGARRDILFINECNNVSWEAFQQLEVRTKWRVFLDFNPSIEFWVHDKLLTNPELDLEFIKSTYVDNNFLSDEIIKAIESRKISDPNWWRVFGEGELGYSEAQIWNHWQITNSIPSSDNYCYGLDFGFNHPTALIKVTQHDGNYYVEELIYQSGLTNQDIISKIKDLGINKQKEIFADYSRPENIREIYLAGYNIKDANKDVKKGIDSVRSKNLFIHAGSKNLLRELKSYSWKTDRDGKLLEEPIKVNDDACDALRYAIHSWTQAEVKKIMPRGFGNKLYKY